MFRKTRLSLAVSAAFSAGLVGVAPQVSAQQTLERVEITGSAIRRTEAEGALPVQTITREEIAKSGVTSVQDLLLQVSAVATAGGTQSAEGAGLSTYGASTASLRGLGDNRTLVLINGRRVANFGAADGVNLNNLPLAAIDRVEVLKDGASAIYGSDAIAGVINFILIKSYQGFEASATYGTPTQSGGGENTRLSLIGGYGDINKDRFNVTAGFAWERQNNLWAKDRDFAKTGNVSPYLFSGATGTGNIEGAINTAATGSDGFRGVRQPGFGNSPGTGYGNPLAATNNCEQINMYRNLTPTTRGYPFCAFDSSAFLNLIPDRETYGLSLNGAFKLSEAAELFGDFIWSKSEVTFAIQPAPLRRSFMTTDSRFLDENKVPALLLRPGNPAYSTAANYLTSIGQGALVGQDLAFTSRVFDFGFRTTQDESTQTRLVLGARGQVFKQDWEVAYAYNKNELKGSVTDGYFSQVDFADVVNAPGSDYNPFTLTQSAATTAALAGAKYAGPTLDSSVTTNVFDGKLGGTIAELPAGPLLYAAGASYSKDELDYSPSPALLTGDIAGLGGASGAIVEDRTILSLYGEIAVPIIKGLEATGAIRWDDYDDVGSKTTYKATVRYQPIQQVLLRAAYGTGFRAPSLSDLWTPQLLGSSAQFTDPVTGQTNLQVNELSGGNPNLKPETSTQTTLGIILQPIPEFSFGVDWFSIEIEDLIAQPSTQEVVSGNASGNPSYAGLVQRTPTGDIEQTQAVFVNAGDAKVQGYDIQFNFAKTYDFGRLGASLFGTYYTKFDQTSPGGFVSNKVATIVEANGDPVLDGDNGGVVLRWKHQLAFSYTRGPWGGTLIQNFYNGYETGNRQVDGERNFVDSQSIWDLQFAYTGLKNATFRLGINNIFDTDPPIFVPVSNQFQAGYDASLYNPQARFVYLTASYKFF